MFPAALLSTLLLALAVAAKPVVISRSPVSLPVTRRFQSPTGKLNVLQRDQARASHLKNRKAKKVARQENESVANVAEVYQASIGVGSPATQYTLLIDTGSSNTWVGADQKYVKTSTSKSTGKSVSVSYGSGEFSGTEFTDTVTITDNLVITGQSIGVASSSQGFDGFDGILGIGPVDLTEETVSGTSTVPTVTDNLLKQGLIDTEVIGISFNPTNSSSALSSGVVNGELTWGGTDSSLFEGSITFTSITKTSPASDYWGINESITYGSSTVLSSTAGIVDTGTTLILIATNAFNTYTKLTGASEDQTTGLLKISSSNFNKLENLNFKIGSTTFALTPNAQIWPRSLNTAIGGTSSGIYLVVADIGNDSGSGLDFINGYTFLERFYSVFDTTNKRVGFATTANTNAIVN